MFSQPPAKDHSLNKPMQPEDYKRIEQDLQNQLLFKRQQETRQQEGRQRVDSWNMNFNSAGTVDKASSYNSSGTDYDSIIGEEGQDTFYSMPSNHDALPPLEEPILPADMLPVTKGSGNLLRTSEFCGLGSLQSSCKLTTAVGQRIQFPGMK